MQYEDVTEFRGIKVGDQVTVVKESGFHAGRPQQKVVKAIRLIEWTQEEAVRLGNHQKGHVFTFTDGSTAGTFDRVSLLGGTR